MAKGPAIKIDKGIPLPKAAKRGSKYPWSEMKIGDSFFVEGEPKGLYGSAKDYNVKIAVRKAVENGKSGVRVWRVSAGRGRGKGKAKAQ